MNILWQMCVFSAGLAWLVIPRTSAHFSLGGLDFQSWRVFVLLCSVPSLSSALLFWLLMPESPKFLMEVLSGQAFICWLLFSSDSAFDTFTLSLPGWSGERGDPRVPLDV